MNVRALSARKTIVAVSLVASGLVLGGTASVVTTANATESSTTTPRPAAAASAATPERPP